MTTKNTGYENYHFHTQKRNVQFHFPMWVLIKNEYGP